MKDDALKYPVQGEEDLYGDKEKSGWRGMNASLSSPPLRNNACENAR